MERARVGVCLGYVARAAAALALGVAVVQEKGLKRRVVQQHLQAVSKDDQSLKQKRST